MNQEQGFTVTLKTLLIVVLIVAVVLGLTVWFVVYRLEQDSVDDIATTDEPMVTVSPTPVQATPTLNLATQEPFDNSLTTALTVVAKLTDADSSNDSITDSLGRNNFLKKLVSQIGSTGEIITNQMSTFTYYTEWYIDGYTGNTTWSADTPWCASYISWCLSQVNLSITGEVPRYANVDHFMTHFSLEQWLLPGATPTPGDIVFFGDLGDANHMGVVLATEGNYIYTIEGNTNDVVGIRKYTLTDDSILGYGVISWAN